MQRLGFRDYRALVRVKLTAAGIAPSDIDDGLIVTAWRLEMTADDLILALLQQAAWLERRAADFAALAQEGSAQ